MHVKGKIKYGWMDEYQGTNVSELHYTCDLKLSSYVVNPALVQSFSGIRLIFLL